MFNIDTRSVTFNLIVINSLVLFATVVFGDKMYELFALFYPASPFFKPMQLVTHMFMHGSFMHLLSNMFALFMFGTVLEKMWGPQRFLFYYFSTGLGAMLLHSAVQALIIHNISGSFAPPLSVMGEYPAVMDIYRTPTVGASGAVFGLLAAFGMLLPDEMLIIFPLPFPIKAKIFVLLYAVFELTMGVAAVPGDQIAHFAHLGGALFGFLLVKFWNRNRYQKY